MRSTLLALMAAVLVHASAATAQTVDTAQFIIAIGPPETVAILPPETQSLGGETVGITVREEGNDLRISLSGDILFDFDKATLRKEAEPALKQAADLIAAHPGSRVRIEGHTDSKGSDKYNMKLSQRRGQAVRSWLVSTTGLESGSFAVKAFAARQPVAPNENADGSDNPEGRAQNRRVEIIVEK